MRHVHGADVVTQLVVDSRPGQEFGDVFLPSWVSAPVVAAVLERHGVLVEFDALCDCGYSLRGLQEPRCPECGAEVDERLLDLDRLNEQ